MVKLQNTITPSKYLINEIITKIASNTDVMSYSLRLAIINKEPDMKVISMLQDYIGDITSVGTIVELLGVELTERIKSFQP